MSLRCIMQTLLFAEIFVSTVIWDFCTALLAPNTSTMHILQLLHFASFQCF